MIDSEKTAKIVFIFINPRKARKCYEPRVFSLWHLEFRHAIYAALYLKKTTSFPTLFSFVFFVLLVDYFRYSEIENPSRQNPPKRQIDARRFVLAGFRHAMPPMMLQCSRHQQQIAVLQFDIDCLGGFNMANFE